MTVDYQTKTILEPNPGLQLEQSMERMLYNNIPPALTDAFSPRSAGSAHEYFSEGDYWWPASETNDPIYVRRDGETNPDNFIEHRKLMIKMSSQAAEMTNAWKLSGDRRYAKKAINVLSRWFLNKETRMLPHLQYSQAISGICSGRSIGVIDSIHLIEAALSARELIKADIMDEPIANGLKSWFKEYLNWLLEHKFGITERRHNNNHGTCWYLQAAAFALLTDNESVLELCRKDYKEKLLPEQMAPDGSFPPELARTKPYGYSLFNLEAMTALCQLASVPDDNLFYHKTADGRSIALGLEFLYPYVKNKSAWPYGKDIAYWNKWPAKHAFLYFGAIAYDEPKYLELWNSLVTDTSCFEVLRNLPVKNPVIWL
jgi:Alginate lyase